MHSLDTNTAAFDPNGIAAWAGFGLLIVVALRFAAVRMDRQARADDTYSKRWASANGFIRGGHNAYPHDSPLQNAGVKPLASDLFKKRIADLDVAFYNYSYEVKTFDPVGARSEPERREFRVMRLAGRTVPTDNFALLREDAKVDVKWEREFGFWNQREHAVSLESSAFNRRYELSIADTSDQIAVRRVFNPSAVHALTTLPFPFPCLLYFENAWWTVEDGQFKVRDLDEWLPKIDAAVAVVKQLSPA
jgi:hypothetical protein